MTSKTVFILSLPRSGSTLLQRYLLKCHDVAAPPEPWVLIPFLNILRPNYVQFSEYNSRSYQVAICDLEQLVGKQNVRSAISMFYQELTGHISDGRIFVDKTPRYHVFSRELYKTFPEAKFIILERNPLAVSASICKSWRGGRFELQDYYIDLFEGFVELNAFKNETLSSDRVLVLGYDDLVSPEFDWGKVIRFVGSSASDEYIKKQDLPEQPAGMGDQVGSKKYSGISSRSAEEWMEFYSNPLRRIWASWYVEHMKKRYGISIPKPENFPHSQNIIEMLLDTLSILKGLALRVFKLNVLKTSRNRVLR